MKILFTLLSDRFACKISNMPNHRFKPQRNHFRIWMLCTVLGIIGAVRQITVWRSLTKSLERGLQNLTFCAIISSTAGKRRIKAARKRMQHRGARTVDWDACQRIPAGAGRLINMKNNMMNNMKYNIYGTAAAIDAGRRMEIKDVLDIAGALLFMMCAMALAVALLWFSSATFSHSKRKEVFYEQE